MDFIFRSNSGQRSLSAVGTWSLWNTLVCSRCYGYSSYHLSQTQVTIQTCLFGVKKMWFFNIVSSGVYFFQFKLHFCESSCMYQYFVVKNHIIFNFYAWLFENTYTIIVVRFTVNVFNLRWFFNPNFSGLLLSVEFSWFWVFSTATVQSPCSSQSCPGQNNIHFYF